MQSSLKSTVESLRQLIAILISLSITNGIMVLLTGSTYGKIIPFNALPKTGIILCIILIFTCLRFYHGNMKSIHLEYNAFRAGSSSGKWLFVDLVVFTAQTLFISLISFYINDFNQFLVLYLVLLVFDSAWGFVRYISLKIIFLVKNIPEVDRIQKPNLYRNWAAVNLVSGVALFASWRAGVYGGMLYVLLALNTVADYCINWRYYVPIQKVVKREDDENGETEES